MFAKGCSLFSPEEEKQKEREAERERGRKREDAHRQESGQRWTLFLDTTGNTAKRAASCAINRTSQRRREGEAGMQASKEG